MYSKHDDAVKCEVYLHALERLGMDPVPYRSHSPKNSNPGIASLFFDLGEASASPFAAAWMDIFQAHR